MTIDTIHARDLDRQLLNRLTENVIDLDIVVDDCRRNVDCAVRALRAAVVARDAVVERLTRFLEAA